jgi:Zn-dependent protease
MTPTRQGSIRLFRLLGVDVFLHWSWLIVAAYQIQERARGYSSIFYPIMEYLSLFAIVLMHEFGHALACRSVGGQANQIVLWPLGGVAYVAPPPRPGAMLWSIAAGPLVNVVLAPILTVAMMSGSDSWFGWEDSLPELYKLVKAIWELNLVLLVFNMLPIYPLDGGQIFRSLLWFVFGRAQSLMIAAITGFVGVAAMVVAAIFLHSVWFGILAFFVLLNCWGGLMQARVLAKIAKLPRRPGFACPSCKQPPPFGAFWRCDECKQAFDTFETGAVCPRCGTQFRVTRCIDCGNSRPMIEWVTPRADSPPILPN